jgi:hypothetical protein
MASTAPRPGPGLRRVAPLIPGSVESGERGAAPAAYYSVADERYFLGAVGLINSLRLVGHDEPIHVLDRGLTDDQRGLLGREAALVPAPSRGPGWLQKTLAPLRDPAEVMVILDADIIVTRPLTELVEKAAGGPLVAFRNPVDRFVPEWGELLELGTAGRRPYVSSAAVFIERALGVEILRLLEDRQRLVDFELTHWRRNVPGYPFTYADQDVLNAILCTRLAPERLVALEQRLAATPPFAGLSLLDERTLRCAYDDGVEPYLIHHHVAKPWLEPTHHGIYSRLLRRLLVGEDVAVRVPEAHLPLRFRSGMRAYAERKRINARERFRWHIREPLAERLRGGES